MKYFVYICASVALFIFLTRFLNLPEVVVMAPQNTESGYVFEEKVNLFFPNSLVANADCESVFPVERKVLKAETLGPGALLEVIAGPSDTEKINGYYTEVENFLLEKFEIKDAIAYVVFDASFSDMINDEENSCAFETVRAQIERTLIDLPDIDSVVITSSKAQK